MSKRANSRQTGSAGGRYKVLADVDFAIDWLDLPESSSPARAEIQRARKRRTSGDDLDAKEKRLRMEMLEIISIYHTQLQYLKAEKDLTH